MSISGKKGVYMARKSALIIAFCLILASPSYGFEHKKWATVTPLLNRDVDNYQVVPHFASAEICTVRHDYGVYWAITHWLTGAELYKAYQNPGLACTGPYPFVVENIYFVLLFEATCTLYVSVDVETADLTNPDCPWPGELLSISRTYQVTIPEAGIYQIEVPLDSFPVVNEPYFAGFYFANPVDTLAGACLITDSVPTPCVAYNIWDTAIGYVDLDSTGFPSFPQFPGRILLFSSGTTGGHGDEEPEPSVTIIKPTFYEEITGEGLIWAAETAGSRIVDYVRFDYRSNSAWNEIDSDYDGSRTLRNGIDYSGIGDGYMTGWTYSGLTEGNVWISATVYDTLGRTDVDSIMVSVDPTPPDPTFVTLGPTDTLCLPVTLEVSSDDEDITVVIFEKKDAPMDYQIPVITLNQTDYGDVDGDPTDGNPIASGEYGEYYCGPVAGAIAVKYWFDRGYIYCMREGNQYLSVDTVVERLAANMLTHLNHGTYDDLFYYGLQQYNITHGNELRLDYYRKPDYALFRTLLQERELLLILGLSGTPGLYLVAAGVSGWADSLGQFSIRVSDPLTGTIFDTDMINTITGAQVNYDGGWHDLDIIITVMGYTHTVTRDYIGADNSSVGGWTFDWSSSDMTEDSLYFITARANDGSGRTELATSLVQYKCELYSKGDYNGDGAVNAGDALYLINFIYKGGPPPLQGAGRADANCDTDIDISDVISIIKYIYGIGSEPCY
jgi:hypothetical protein